MDRDYTETNLFLEDVERLKRSVEATRFTPLSVKNVATDVAASKPAQQHAEQTELVSRVGNIAKHLSSQWQQHLRASQNTSRLFECLLSDLDIFCGCFNQQLQQQKNASDSSAVPTDRVWVEIDPDRSVGVLHLLWHTVTFTTRANAKPLAIYRYNKSPVFTGRIVAITGHLNDISDSDLWQDDFTQLLSNELTSLYVPAENHTPAVMTVKHLGDEEYPLDQVMAPRQFLLKTVEMLSAGGCFHERELY